MVARLVPMVRRPDDDDATDLSAAAPGSGIGRGGVDRAALDPDKTRGGSRDHWHNPPANETDRTATGRAGTGELEAGGIELRGSELHIGESTSGEIVIGDPGQVAQPRAILRKEEHRWVVRSAGPQPLLVNGKSTTESPLRRDDILELWDGSARFTFRDDHTSYDPLDRVLRFLEQSGQLPHGDQLIRYTEQFLSVTTRADEFQLLKSDGTSFSGEAVRPAIRAALQTVRTERRALLEVAADGSSMLCVPNFSVTPPLFIYLSRSATPSLGEADRRVASACARLLPYLQQQLGVRDTLFDEVQSLRNQVTQPLEMFSGGAAYQHVLQQAQGVAAGNDPVLVHGEHGVGKQVLARFLHSLSSRVGGPFVATDCTLISPREERNLLGEADRSEAIDGRRIGSIGRWQRAQGGTLFLGQVGELSPSLQQELLSLIDRHELRPVGSGGPLRVDVRVVASTDRELLDLVEQGRFDRELYKRLCVRNISIPALRERREEIVPMAQYFLQKLRGTGEQALHDQIESDAVKLLIDHDWPGNVGELHSRIRAADLLSRGEALRGEHFRDLAADKVSRPPKIPTLAELEYDHILRVLQITQGNKKEAARLLGIHRNTLTLKLQRADDPD